MSTQRAGLALQGRLCVPIGAQSRVGDTGLLHGCWKGYMKSHLRLVAEHDHGVWHILQECGVSEICKVHPGVCNSPKAFEFKCTEVMDGLC